jgi:hypothetical protein
MSWGSSYNPTYDHFYQNMEFHSSNFEHSSPLQILGRIALYKGSVIYIFPLLLKLFVQSLPTISSCCAKFKPHWPSQSSSPKSQSFCPAESLVKEVQARSSQMLWNFEHMFPHPYNPCMPSLGQIQQAKVRPPSPLYFWTNWAVVKEVLVALVLLSWNFAEYLIWAYHWPNPRFSS